MRALNRARTAAATEWERHGVAPVWGDLGSEEALSNLVAGGRVVFHCAAAVGSSAEESYAVNVEGTRRLAAAAARHGCDRFVHLAIAETDGVCPVLNRYNKLISNDGTAVTVSRA